MEKEKAEKEKIEKEKMEEEKAEKEKIEEEKAEKEKMEKEKAEKEKMEKEKMEKKNAEKDKNENEKEEKEKVEKNKFEKENLENIEKEKLEKYYKNEHDLIDVTQLEEEELNNFFLQNNDSEDLETFNTQILNLPYEQKLQMWRDAHHTAKQYEQQLAHQTPTKQTPPGIPKNQSLYSKQTPFGILKNQSPYSQNATSQGVFQYSEKIIITIFLEEEVDISTPVSLSDFSFFDTGKPAQSQQQLGNNSSSSGSSSKNNNSNNNKITKIAQLKKTTSEVFFLFCFKILLNIKNKQEFEEEDDHTFNEELDLADPDTLLFGHQAGFALTSVIFF